MAPFTVMHDYISFKKLGKDGKPFGKGRATANAHYITRKSAEYVRYVGFSPNKFMAEREFAAYEDAVKRKDTRLTHTLIIAIPRELNRAQRKKLIDDYAWKLTKRGKAAGIFAVHTDKEHNPHIHISFTDRDLEFVYNEDKNGTRKLSHCVVGQTVQKLTAKTTERIKLGLEPSATEFIREMWERVGNKHLEDAGFEPSLDRRTLLAQGIDRQAENHRGPEMGSTEVDLPEAKSGIIVEPLSTVVEIEPDKMPEPDDGMTPDELLNHVAQLQDNALIEDIENGIPLDEPVFTPAELVEGALNLDTNRRWLKEKREKIVHLELAAEEADKAAEASLHYAAEQERKADLYRDYSRVAQDDLAKYTRSDGSIKGFEFKLLGRKFATKSRRKALELQSEIELHDHFQREAGKSHSNHLFTSESHTEAARLHREHAQAIERQLKDDAEAARDEANEIAEVYGDKITLTDTDQVLEAGIQQNLSKVTPEQICAEHENGSLTTEQAGRALELMGAHRYLVRIEGWERKLRDNDISY